VLAVALVAAVGAQCLWIRAVRAGALADLLKVVFQAPPQCCVFRLRFGVAFA
jgi:hypothetical protein